MTRLNKILVGLAVAQLALVFVMLTRDDSIRIAPMQPVLAGLDPAGVTKLAVFDKNADHPAIELVRAGDAWTLASSFGHPADPTKVTDLLAKLGALKSRGPIATTAVRHQQLGVADTVFEKKLVLTTAKGELTLLVGNADQGRTTAVRVGGRPEVFAINGLTAWGIEVNPSRWVDDKFLQLDPTQISRVLIQGAGAPLELERTATGWQLGAAGQPVGLAPGVGLDAEAIDKLIQHVATMTLFAPGDPARDASAPTATISIWIAAPDAAVPGTEPAAERAPDHVIDVIADGDNYWVHDRAGKTAALIGKAGLDDVVTATAERLVKQPATPDPPGPGKSPPKPAPEPPGLKPGPK